jgi:acyl-CoA thioester hydrolase
MKIDSLVLGVEAKRLHIAHVMHVDGVRRATFECLGLHFDTRDEKTVAFPEEAQAMFK